MKINRKYSFISTAIIIFFLSTFLIFSLYGCQNNKRIEDLQNQIVNLQEQLSEKEDKINELENTKVTTIPETAVDTPIETTAEISDEKTIEDVINSYIDAIEKEDFNMQKSFVSKYAFDLVNFKDRENKKAIIPTKSTFTKQPVGNIQINGSNAEAFMSFTEHLEYNDGTKYDLVTEGKVLLENSNNEWKITDYTRKNRLISEALFNFKNVKVDSNYIEITLDYVLFSLFDKYVLVGVSIYNGTDKNLRYYSSNAIIVGPDKKQIKAQYYDPNIENLLIDTIASGEIEFNWDYDSNNNFSVNTGNFIDKDGYDYLNNIKFEIDLDNAVRY